MSEAAPKTPPKTAATSASMPTVPTAAAQRDKNAMVQIPAPQVNSRLKMLEHVLDNMRIAHGTGVMIGGSTGIGKTTFVKQVAKLLGLKLIVLEAPHITEEEVINIPFITIDNMHDVGKQTVVRVDAKKYGVQLAKSHLATALQAANSISDQQYLKEMSSPTMDASTKELFHALGGSDDVIPPEIARLRKKYRVILFIDEYLRQTTQNVRNILRGILNGRIGSDHMPAGVYVAYATNLSDVGSTIEQVPKNQDFKQIDMQPPSKDEFFRYLIGRFEKDEKVKLKPVVVNAFYSALTDGHISYDDLDAEIRTSPRRWEQIILYVNASVPVKDKEDAAALMANVKANFSSEKDVSNLHKLVETIVRDIIRDTGGAALANTKALDAGSWRETLQHQIEAKIKTGAARSYVPVVMGNPGIGKTAAMAQIAHNLNMRLIDIDCSTLSAEDVTGIPIPREGERKDGKRDMSVTFAEPSLYQRITEDMRHADEKFENDPNVSEEQKADYRKKKYKYILFWDELNRVNNSNVFNSLRRVILEKSFNDTVKLPDNCIMTAAMNPGDKLTSELTGHLKDSIDLIDGQPSWAAFKSWFDNKIANDPDLEDYTLSAKEMAKKILLGFIETFSIKVPMKTEDRPSTMSADELPFYIKVQGADAIYISPREYFSMYGDILGGIQRGMDKNINDENVIGDNIMEKIEHTLKWVLKKHDDTESPQLLLAVANWVKSKLKEFMIKKRTSVGLAGMIDATLEDNSKHLKDDPNFINYTRSFDNSKFVEEMTNYFDRIINEEDDALKALLTDKHTKKSLEKDQIKLLDEMTDTISYIINEIKMAIKVNELSNQVLDGLESALVNSLDKNLTDDEIPDDTLKSVLDKIHDLFI